MTASRPPKNTQTLSDTKFLQELRLQMLKFACLQLNDESAAEDVVQETFIGAFNNIGSFGGKAAIKSWVFAILKNKIIDHLRVKNRMVQVGAPTLNSDEGQDFSDLFNGKGYWHQDEHPQTWGNPDEYMKQDQFWEVFEVCLDNLPGEQGRAFMMREFIEFESNEICDTLAISESNLNVMLYRARMRLRECLTIKWFTV